MNIIRYSIRSFFTNEYYSIIRFASKRLFVATLFIRDEKNVRANSKHITSVQNITLSQVTYKMFKNCLNKLKQLQLDN